MKLIFGFLLLLSIGLFVLMQWGGEWTGAGKNSQLLGELNAEKVKLLDVPFAKLIPASSVSASPQPVLPSVVETSVAPAPSIMPPVVLASAPVVASAPAVAAVIRPPVPASAPPAVVKPVVALPVAPPVTVAKSVVKTCIEWGEFSGVDLARASRALDSLKLGERLSTHTVEYASGYWVYIPPLPNKAGVKKKIEELKALGIEDYFVMKESRKWNNAISLGVFKTEEAAKKYLSLMKKQGVRSAKVGERKHKLKFTVFTLNGVDAELSTHMTALQKEYSGSELKPSPCKN